MCARRGVLLHGVPGSGKTAAVRALAGECARSAPQPVALFVRKGADCLGKYAGDAERTLRMLFEEVCEWGIACKRVCVCMRVCMWECAGASLSARVHCVHASAVGCAHMCMCVCVVCTCALVHGCVCRVG